MTAQRTYTDDERRARKRAYESRRRAENGAHVRAIEAASRQKTDASSRAATWRAEHVDHLKTYFKTLQAARMDAGYFDSPEVKAKRHAYYLATFKERKAYSAQWKKENADLVRQHQHTRRARQTGAGGVLSKDIVSRLLLLQRTKCTNCKGKLDKYHIDHIQPISKCGRNEDRNVQLLCPPCNLRKHAKDPIAFAQEQGRLL